MLLVLKQRQDLSEYGCHKIDLFLATQPKNELSFSARVYRFKNGVPLQGLTNFKWKDSLISMNMVTQIESLYLTCYTNQQQRCPPLRKCPALLDQSGESYPTLHERQTGKYHGESTYIKSPRGGFLPVIHSTVQVWNFLLNLPTIGCQRIVKN